jgi:hypothetical protein
MTYTDYYLELYDCVQAAKDGKIELWEYVDVNILKRDYDYKNEPKSPYITKEELMILLIKDYDTTLKRIARIYR